MKLFLVLVAVSLLVLFIFFIAYAPVIWNRLRIKAAKRTLATEVEALGDVIQRSCMVVTEPLGEGASQNSGIRFAKASKNLDVAVNSSRALMASMKIMRD